MKRFRVALLVLTTFFWGVTFTVVKEAIGRVDVYVFLAQRFLVAFAVLLPIALASRAPLDRRTLRQGTVLGALLFSAFAFQTVSLRYTTASNVGFLTGLNVVFTPLFGGLLLKHAVPGKVRAGVALAVAGLFLLCTGGRWQSFNHGDLLAATCAVFVAFHTLFTGRFASEEGSSVPWLAAVQIGTMTLLSAASSLLKGAPLFVVQPGTVPAILVCALLATVFAFLVQTSVQRHMNPTQVALVFCLEPLFAAGYAYWMIGERLGIAGTAGGALILSGMLLSEAVPLRFWRGMHRPPRSPH